MRQKHLGFLEYTRGLPHNVQTDTSLVSDHTYQWGPSVSTANPTWGDIFERSKLKARTSLLPRFSEKRRSSFELRALKLYSKISPQVGLAVMTFPSPTLPILRVPPGPLNYNTLATVLVNISTRGVHVKTN